MGWLTTQRFEWGRLLPETRFVQEARRDEKPELIAKIVKHCVETFRKVRGYYPGSIIIYRNAIAEGQWPGILKYEVPFIDVELDSLGLSVDPIVIVPNKLHRVRFYPTEVSHHVPLSPAVPDVLARP